MTETLLTCPSWCSGHDAAEPDPEHFEIVVSPVWLGAYQRVDGVTTRPHQGTYSICLRGGVETGELFRVNDRLMTGVVRDSVVEVQFEDGPGGDTTVLLLAGEARELAATLLKAADRLLRE